MPEWSNGAVSKTVELLVGSGGSNPPLSAKGHKRTAGLARAVSFMSFGKARRRRQGKCDRREQIP